MNLPAALILGAVLSADPLSGVIKNSTSPNGKYDVLAEQSADGNYSRYQVESHGHYVSDELDSDLGNRTVPDACNYTPIFWSPDSTYFVLNTSHGRHHGDFLIVKKTGKRFFLFPLDREKALQAAHVKPMAFIYPSFIRWLPKDRLEVELMNFDGIDIFQPIHLVLDLKNHLNVVSWKVLKSEKSG